MSGITFKSFIFKEIVKKLEYSLCDLFPESCEEYSDKRRVSMKKTALVNK